jgi:hypothetical protein
MIVPASDEEDKRAPLMERRAAATMRNDGSFVAGEAYSLIRQRSSRRLGLQETYYYVFHDIEIVVMYCTSSFVFVVFASARFLVVIRETINVFLSLVMIAIMSIPVF